jgi:hypothetical protein
VHPDGDLIDSLCEIPDLERFAETSALFISLSIAFTSGALVVIGFVSECIGGKLVY